MKRKDFIRKIKEETERDLGVAIQDDIFLRALKKAQLWIRDAYGSPNNFEDFIAETGGSIASYYEECMVEPKGIDTENRRRMFINKRNKTSR